MASKLYGQFLSQALNKEIDWDTDTIKVALLTNSYTPDQDAHNYLDDVIANEVTGATGYTAGGNTLANKTNSYNSATNVIVLDADDTTWSSSTITARYAVIACCASIGSINNTYAVIKSAVCEISDPVAISIVPTSCIDAVKTSVITLFTFLSPPAVTF